MHKLSYIFLYLIVFIFIGCSSKTPLTSNVQDVSEIEALKHEEIIKDISINDSNEGDFLKVFINEYDAISFICLNSNFCERKQEIGENIILVDDNSYSPSININKEYNCGRGSFMGYLALLGLGYEDYESKNYDICHHRFTSTSDTQIAERIGGSIFTFGTALVSGGDRHKEKFDAALLKEAIVNTGLYRYKDDFITLAQDPRFKESGLDFVYIDPDNVEDSLDKAYNRVLATTSSRAGVVFINTKTKKLIDISMFNDFKSASLMSSINKEVNALLKKVVSNQDDILEYKEISPYVPNEVAIPSLPTIPKFVKDEFEKGSAFEMRVAEAVISREKEIRSLERSYKLQVLERNLYLNRLEDSYKEYLKANLDSKSILHKRITDNLGPLVKLMFVENMSGYYGEDFSYDAEEEKLYFTLHTKRKDVNKKVVSIMPALYAKKIKQDKSFEIRPELYHEKNAVKLNGYSIIETDSGEVFDVKYTDVNFKPEYMYVSINTINEKITKEIGEKFEQYKQEPQSIVDAGRKETWYIDVANRYNARVPNWFINPSNSFESMGFGEGQSLREALSNAREELAYMLKVNVKSKYTKTDVWGTAENSSIKSNETLLDTSITLKQGDYQIYKQESSDGKWYVALKYLRPLSAK